MERLSWLSATLGSAILALALPATAQQAPIVIKFSHVTMSETPKGLMLRIQSSRVLEAQMRSVGAPPQVMAFSEVYQATQTGVVDGSENTLSNIFTQKHHEVQKFLTLADHGYIGYAVITNKKFREELPADLRGILEGAMKDATRHANEVAKKENDDAPEGIRKSGKSRS